jgi:hypothetical protein
MFVCSTVSACSIGSNLHRVGFIVSGFKVSGFKGKCGATKAEFILICTTLSIKTKVNKKPGGNYLVKINASDPQNNSASKMFEITVTKAIPW